MIVHIMHINAHAHEDAPAACFIQAVSWPSELSLAVQVGNYKFFGNQPRQAHAKNPPNTLESVPQLLEKSGWNRLRSWRSLLRLVFEADIQRMSMFDQTNHEETKHKLQKGCGIRILLKEIQ